MSPMGRNALVSFHSRLAETLEIEKVVPERYVKMLSSEGGGSKREREKDEKLIDQGYGLLGGLLHTFSPAK